MKVVYAVAYIEIEYGWGERPEGYALYLDKDKCAAQTKESSKHGNYESGEGYYGPVRPLSYREVPYDSLDEKLKKELDDKGVTHTDNHWSPKFEGKRINIE